MLKRGVVLIDAGTSESNGKVAGDALKVSIPPEEGYGVRDDSKRFEIPREVFKDVDEVIPGMQFQVQALPADQFAMWAQGSRGRGPALDGRGYAELSHPSSYVKPMTYGTVAPGLFDAIVANRAPQLHVPAAAPPANQASAVPVGG